MSIPYLYGYMLNLMSKYADLGGHLSAMSSKLDSAGYYIGAENWASAKAQLQAAAIQCGYASDDVYLVGGSIHYWTWYCFLSIDDYEFPVPEEYELTAEKICLAWAKDEFKDRALTIAFIDRMRQLIWDEPFYVAWASRPESR